MYRAVPNTDYKVSSCNPLSLSGFPLESHETEGLLSLCPPMVLCWEPVPILSHTCALPHPFPISLSCNFTFLRIYK